MRVMRWIPFCEANGGQGGGGGNGGGGGGYGGGASVQQTQPTGGQQSQPPAIDYDRIAQILEGKQAATEESVLKGYFKQQGLTKEQADQAIAAFKQQQAANQPDVAAMQTQLTQAQAAAQQAQIQSAATMAAVSLGIDAKTIPYVLKMADLGQIVGQDGKINEETLKNALNKVLEDIPALKPQAAGTTGFIQIGAAGGQGSQSDTDAELDRIFGVKKK